jgi:hypothetical protein
MPVLKKNIWLSPLFNVDYAAYLPLGKNGYFTVAFAGYFLYNHLRERLFSRLE